MGGSDRKALLSSGKVHIVALCDVDANTLNQAASELPDAKKFSDWREMLAAVGDKIDAVHVATPDYMHAPVAMTAVNMGKHVYCQKPLTHQVNEARQLRLAASRKNVVTQMGIQINSYSGYRNAVELVHQGPSARWSKCIAGASRRGVTKARCPRTPPKRRTI
jgi:predicted dehydrogenase